jgi:hypothetical protein
MNGEGGRWDEPTTISRGRDQAETAPYQRNVFSATRGSFNLQPSSDAATARPVIVSFMRFAST